MSPVRGGEEEGGRDEERRGREGGGRRREGGEAEGLQCGSCLLFTLMQRLSSSHVISLHNNNSRWLFALEV